MKLASPQARLGAATCLALSLPAASDAFDSDGAASFCGSALTPDDARAAQHLRASGVYDTRDETGDPVSVTIAWHILEDFAAHPAIDDDTLAGYMEYANEMWAPANIRLESHPVVDRIENTAWCRDVPSVDTFRTMRRLDNALNIYWAPAGSMGSLCGISAFTFSSLDTIAIQRDCQGFVDVQGVLCHEIGHWFDLFHTHETAGGRECVARTNCDHAGDNLCDTPACFGLGFTGCVDATTCELRPECMDYPGPCTDDPVYTPDPLNFMAYTAVPCMTTFTPQGYERMRSTAVELRGDYINTNLHHPCASDCTNDLNTNVDDVLAVLGVYGSPCEPPCPEDVTGDGQVGVDDILAIIRSWGPCFACLSNQDCDDGDPWTLDRCHFGDCVHEPHLADCCIQGTCVRRIPAEVCETNDGVSMLTDTDCRWTCGRGDECLSAQQAFFGENRFTNQYATVGDLHPVDDTLCPDTNFAWDEPTDVWFWFNTSDPGTAAFSLCDADSFDTALVLYRGAYLCEDMVQIACSGDAPPETDCQAGHSSVTAEVGPGIEGRLFIRIAGQSGQTGHGTLTITRLE